MVNMRAFIEDTTRDWQFIRTLPRCVGGNRIYVSPSGGLRYLFRPMKEIDPSLIRNAIEFVCRENVIWDIGANVGLFSFAAAHVSGPTGKVFAFEPDPWLASLLQRSARLQKATSAPINVVPVAAADSTSLRVFNIARRSRSANALHGFGLSQAGGFVESLWVPAFRLDDLLQYLPSPNIVKCDVEGAEMAVFSEQSELLNDVRPTIICEVDAINRISMSNLFDRHRYLMFDGNQPFNRASPIQEAAWNTIAIPTERA